MSVGRAQKPRGTKLNQLVSGVNISPCEVLVKCTCMTVTLQVLQLI